MSTAARKKFVISAVLTALVTTSVAFAVPAGAQSATCHGQRATIVAKPGQVTVGTARGDVIVGTSGRDIIRAGGGADIICARGGNDDVKGGSGADLIDLGSGNDYGRGGRGADTILGGSGRDAIKGQGGNDLLLGQNGADKCRGGAGRDALQSCNDSTANSDVGTVNIHEAAMVAMLQDLRDRHGVGQLDVNIRLADVAGSWSTTLPGGFEHNPRVGSQIPRGWWAWGENIAHNGSVEEAFDALVRSPGHFANMIDPDFTDVGIGIHVRNGRVYVTQVFAEY